VGEEGQEVQSRLVPGLYERVIECAVSERWATTWAELSYVDFGRTSWIFRWELLETHKGEEVKDLETVPGE